MKHRALVAVTIVALAACAITFGLPHIGEQTLPPLSQQNPGPLANADFGKIIVGDFNGDLKGDGIVMDGSTAKWLVTPEVHSTAVSLPGPVNDIAAIKSSLIGGMTPGGIPVTDAVLTVSSAGLVRYDRDTVNSEWDATVIRGPASAWGNANLVAVGNLNGVGKPDIAGISWNGNVLILYANTLQGYTNGVSFSPIGQTVYGLFLLNWREAGDIAGTKEIALLTSAGTELYETNGTLQNFIPWTDPILGTVIKDQGTVLERLAMVSPVGGIDKFYVFGYEKSEGPFDIGPACTVSMASGDADNDGDSEVFLGSNCENKFSKLINASPDAQTFDVTAPVKYAYGPQNRNPANNHAGLVTGHCDGDDSLDVIAPAQGEPFIAHGTVPLITVGPTSPSIYHVRISAAVLAHIEGGDEIRFTLTEPFELLPVDAPAERMLSVMIWHTPTLMGNTLPEPLDPQLIPMPQGEDDTFTMKLPAGYSLATDPDMFSLVFRQVAVTNNPPEVVAISPAWIGILAGGPTWPQVRDAGDTLVYELVYTLDPPETPTGGVGTGPTVPGVDDDVEPRDRDPDPNP